MAQASLPLSDCRKAEVTKVKEWVRKKPATAAQLQKLKPKRAVFAQERTHTVRRQVGARQPRLDLSILIYEKASKAEAQAYPFSLRSERTRCTDKGCEPATFRFEHLHLQKSCCQFARVICNDQCPSHPTSLRGMHPIHAGRLLHLQLQDGEPPGRRAFM